MNKRLAWAGIVLLVLLLAIQGYQLYMDMRAQAQRAELATGVMLLIGQQRGLISGVMDQYHDAAYADHVDRIAEQQLIATEFQLQMLQVLAIQNGQIMELLAGVE